MTAAISNYDCYLGHMGHALEDKAWFMKVVPELSDNSKARILDYGCADCALGRFLVDEKHFTGSYIGVDADPAMKARAEKANVQAQYKNLSWMQGDFCSSEATPSVYTLQPEDTTLVLNSVIHEVYSYNASEQIQQFWDTVWSRRWKRIAIRDMALSRIDADNKVSGTQMLLSMPLDLFGRYRLWQKDYGSSDFASTRDVVHFLLKYRYIENWERESKENYLPLYWEEIISQIPSHYRIIYAKHYCLPFIQQSVLKDACINLEIPTHYQLLLEDV